MGHEDTTRDKKAKVKLKPSKLNNIVLSAPVLSAPVLPAPEPKIEPELEFKPQLEPRYLPSPPLSVQDHHHMDMVSSEALIGAPLASMAGDMDPTGMHLQEPIGPLLHEVVLQAPVDDSDFYSQE